MRNILYLIRKCYFPKNWWKFASSTSILLKHFKSHILGLLIAVWNGTEFQYSIYSGIPLYYKDHLVWITAGHIIDEITKTLSSKTLQLDIVCWLDGYEIKGAEGVRLHNKNPVMYSWKEKGTDIGLLLLHKLDEENLFRNGKFFPIIPQIWMNPKNETPEGYYAIGYPRVWNTHSQKVVAPKQIYHFVKADILCLPLQKINRETQAFDNNCWKKEGSFKGKIEIFPDDPNFAIDSIKGISGGPIFSIQRTKNDRFLYRLIGIVSECDAQQSIICGETISQFEKTMINWIECNIKGK